jgi:hypothetical protein
MRTGHLSGQLTPLHRPRCRRRGGSLGWSDSAPKLRRSVTSGMTSPADPPAVAAQTISRAGGCCSAGLS